VAAVAAAGAATAAWGALEAGWVRLRERELSLPELPPELDGLRIAHLSDFHLGVPSRGAAAVERAVEWTAARAPDLVCITGDLLSRPRGEPRLLELLSRLEHPYVVLGNHDFALSRDPFSKPVDLLKLREATLLLDDAVELELRGRRVELAGVDPRSWLGRRRSGFASSDADLRILLCHFPRSLDHVRPGRFHLVLAGHMHAGQIVLPYPGGRLALAHPRAPYLAGVHERAGTVMHVSPGLGTTFVPFRLFARPEATELVLRCRPWSERAEAMSHRTSSRGTPETPPATSPGSAGSSGATAA
jgi:predicted MPP superfamily phosphohydrolase